MKVLITGGAGFLGSNLARKLSTEGHSVTIYDNLSRTGCVHNLLDLTNNYQVTDLIGDVQSPSIQFHKAVEESDIVYHLAGQVAVTTSVADPINDFEVNALGTLKVLESVRKSQGNKPIVVFSSTNKVYGNLDESELTEENTRYSYRDKSHAINECTPLDLHSPYGCSKGAADQYVRDYARVYGLRTVVFRQSCIYGPNQFGIEDQGWVAWFIIAAVLGKDITIYGDGKQVRDVLFVDDLSAAYSQVVDNIERTAGKIYNIGGGPNNTLSLLELIDFLNQNGLDIPYTFADWRPGDQKIYVSAIDKAKEDFGWYPVTSWKDGVLALFQWAVENKKMVAKILSHV